jgi:hypothetical protein
LTITVDDPSGAAITGSAPYATPLQITTNEPAITVTPATVTAPGQTAMLAYTGVPWQSITTIFSVNVSAGGQTGTLSVPVQQSNLYVANSNGLPGTVPFGNGNIAVYRFGASGTATPLRTITGLNNPVQPMLDSSGNLWVLDNGPYTADNPAPYINVYAPGATGNATPAKRITGFAALDYNQACQTMAFTPNQQQIYVTCGDGAIHVFPTGFNGSVTASSLQTVSLADDSWEGPEVGMAFDNSGNFYVADTGFNLIDQYVTSSLPTSGSYSLIGASTSMSGSGGSWPTNVNPVVLLVDTAGTLYATIENFSATANAADANNQLALWKTTTLPCRNCAPSATLTGAPFTTARACGAGIESALIAPRLSFERV